MKKLVAFLLLLIVVWVVFAQEHSVYGNTTMYGFAHIANDEYLPSLSEYFDDNAQLAFGLVQDLTASFSLGPLTRINMDLVFLASLLNSTESDPIQVAPVQMDVNQLYVQLPLGDTCMLYGGKRIKEMGTAQYFPLVNRINPRLFAKTRNSSQGAGLIELNYFPLHWLNIGGSLFFKDVGMTDAQWDEINILGQIDLQLYPFDISLFSYAECFDNFPLGISSSLQLGFFTLYGEYLYTYKGAIKIIDDAGKSDPLEAFKLRDMNNYHAVTSGLRFSTSAFNLGLEYAFNSDLLTVGEANALSAYINAYNDNDYSKQDLINIYRSPYRYFPHNAVLYGSYTPILIKDLTFAGKTIISFPSSTDAFGRMWGYNGQLSVSYAVAQSVFAQFSYDWFAGGSEAEYVLYEPEQGRVMLMLGISF